MGIQPQALSEEEAARAAREASGTVAGSYLRKGDWLGPFFPLLAIAMALLVSAGVIAAVGKDPVQAYRALFGGAFGNLGQIGTTVTEAIPLMFTGLAVALAFRGGAFNIGGEGQLYMGALLAAIVGGYLNLPAV